MDAAKLPYGRARPLMPAIISKELRKIFAFYLTNPLTVTPGRPSRLNWKIGGRFNDGKDYTTPVRNQYNCPSCVTFGIIAAMESRFRINPQPGCFNPPLPNGIYQSQLVGTDFSEGDMFHCGITNILTGLSYAIEHGACIENALPYTDFCPNICIHYQQNLDDVCVLDDIPAESPETMDLTIPRIKVQKFEELGPVPADEFCLNIIMDREDARTALWKNGPLVTTLYPKESLWDNANDLSQPYQSEGSGDQWLGGEHCVCVVGYEDDENDRTKGKWICKNSWGPEWGDEGWFSIPYDESGIGENGFFSPLVHKEEKPAEIRRPLVLTIPRIWPPDPEPVFLRLSDQIRTCSKRILPSSLSSGE